MSLIEVKHVLFTDNVVICKNKLLIIKQLTISNLNFNPLEVVSRYRDPQLQVGENYSHCFFSICKHLQILMFKHSFYS